MMSRKGKRKLIVSAIFAVVFVAIALVIWLFTSFSKKLYRDFYYEYRYIECKPEELLPDIDRIFNIKFPKEIREVKTARTRGSWDSKNSPFIVRFSAPPDIVDRFIGSFPKEVTFGPYEPKSDFRNERLLFTPQWFAEPIKEGKDGSVYVSYKEIYLYIDTSDKKNFVVYIRGYYEPEEPKQ